MTIDLSSSTDPEILLAATALRHLAPLLTKHRIDFLVVGATARNIVSMGVFGHVPDRRTRDVDIAIAVAGWGEVQRLQSMMTPIAKSCHRFDVSGIPVDIIPCGSIENPDRTVDWPNAFKMNTLGFREAFITAEIAVLPGPFSIRIPAPAAQALLKLVAWFDRHWTNSKDAVDLTTMLDWYDSGWQLDSLYDDHTDLLTLYSYDTALASAHRLGRDIASLLESAALATVRSLLTDQAALERLANDMVGPFSRAHQRLLALRAGIRAEHALR